jgi:hypothetical protein
MWTGRQRRRAIGRSRHAVAAAVGLIAMVIAAFVGIQSVSGVIDASDASGTVATYYLALGGSASIGFQPTASRPQGQPTDTGYANDLLSIERSRWHDLQLVQFGCAGETTDAFLAGGDRCHPYVAQLIEALDFLHTHPDTVLTTIDLGFNDVDHCLAFHMVNEPCVAQRLDGIDQELPKILTALRAAGGPAMRIVGVDHYDPYLGDYLRGAAGQAFAEATLPVIQRLDATLHGIYDAAGVPIANVAQAFELYRTDPTNLAGDSRVPLDVARTCQLTWDCTSVPYRSKQHPNDIGYRIIAQAVAAAPS